MIDACMPWRYFAHPDAVIPGTPGTFYPFLGYIRISQKADVMKALIRLTV